ncbi:hypothetical protein PAHA111176_08400 [Parendozoicomonas haliclonae]|uniref:Uncharacterized protein n=1 Tax=Parendozoicomonas haliclonae TaxID=1960125 RepID=A0A1X7APQ0_9GAMM|nr:hypothetical protein EHSB41UT_03914 [Parendozoicomonas haliclonae]
MKMVVSQILEKRGIALYTDKYSDTARRELNFQKNDSELSYSGLGFTGQVAAIREQHIAKRADCPGYQTIFLCRLE